MISSVSKRLFRDEKTIIKAALPLQNVDGDSDEAPWSNKDLLALLGRVFKFGEAEWDIDLINELD